MRTTDTFVFFWSGPFSNWHPASYVRGGISFANSEQDMMYQKALAFGDADVAAEVLRTPNPKAVKALGRLVKGFDDAVWVGMRADVMDRALRGKFCQDPKLAQLLLDTGERMLVEASPYDRVWGIGLAEDHPDVTDPAKWRGLNELGKSLMRVRAEMQARA
ncbi:NADAR family protein [Paraburkholderia sp. UCT31]|uniref:NADAR family protein n=1 Tax=Paraburkholderia sp. UCT31 TaxID=2615209 RepID=UPI001655590B|nr:NADAR family protein [Paraburkholderia sp. UCT31]MBC8740389.1 NADAR family protein [Paraburkholderia sp. UCT31]